MHSWSSRGRIGSNNKVLGKQSTHIITQEVCAQSSGARSWGATNGAISGNSRNMNDELGIFHAPHNTLCCYMASQCYLVTLITSKTTMSFVGHQRQDQRGWEKMCLFFSFCLTVIFYYIFIYLFIQYIFCSAEDFANHRQRCRAHVAWQTCCVLMQRLMDGHDEQTKNMCNVTKRMMCSWSNGAKQKRCSGRQKHTKKTRGEKQL